MITKMTGTLTRVLDDEVRLQIGPFEYQVLVAETVRRLMQLQIGQEVTFHITEYLEGNAAASRFTPRRIGFTTQAEQEFFELFCTVEKIGVKKALKALARPIKDIADAISRQDTRWLATLPGIGATTAEQIVTTLKRKITPFLTRRESAAEPTADDTANNGKKPKTGTKKGSEPAPEPQAAITDGQLIEDVYEALMGLGHSPVEARTKLDNLLTCGKPFGSLQEALTLIYAQKG